MTDHHNMRANTRSASPFTAAIFASSAVFLGAALAACSGLTAPPSPEAVASDQPVTTAAPTAPAASSAPPQASAPPAPPPIPAPDDVKAPPANAKKTASGIAYRVLTDSKSKEHPKAIDRVTVNYTGWTTDGKMFDSSVTRGQPATFGLNQVIKGWTEGVQLMTPGSKYRFWLPANLAYGDNAGGGRPSGMLVFDIELLSIQPTTPPPGASGSAKPAGSARGK